ncbi:Zn-dependent hydrolase [uncultured Castellaniella sp.]|uniref:Zn-dependent hydrolase n=1 Tax=uncultured Castellaniella sp. TaxID=647907 RepID=UPI0026228DD9|nr:Zn-dependent hydrolase [uncultured Castellaniella sp.]
MGTAIRIDEDRLWNSLMELARIGATPAGGVNRQALTELDGQARALFSAWCREAGCVLRTDPIGNLIARRPGRNDSQPAIMMGSHLDSQPTGGKFDGAYGVMAGLEVLRALHAAGIETERPIEVVAWTNEEGARFAPSMMGSQVYAGLMGLDEALAVRDTEGVSVAEALARIGAQGMADSGSRPAAYFEAHIEQGPLLEAERKTIGVVSGGQGQCWFQMTLTGRASHAGTTPMDMRSDALVGAAAIIGALDRIGRAHPPGCATAGRILVSPNSPNVIPDSVYLTAEIRHPDDAVRAAMELEFRAAADEAVKLNHLDLNLAKVLEQPAAPFDPACIAAIRQAAERNGYPSMEIISGAAHDAVALSRIVPTGMVFVPCAGGVSHNELESAESGDLAAGCQVLAEAVLAYARVSDPVTPSR